jgi:hypothetical protein
MLTVMCGANQAVAITWNQLTSKERVNQTRLHLQGFLPLQFSNNTLLVTCRSLLVLTLAGLQKAEARAARALEQALHHTLRAVP